MPASIAVTAPLPASWLVRRKRVPHALHRMGLSAGPRRHCGESATAQCMQGPPKRTGLNPGCWAASSTASVRARGSSSDCKLGSHFNSSSAELRLWLPPAVPSKLPERLKGGQDSSLVSPGSVISSRSTDNSLVSRSISASVAGRNSRCPGPSSSTRARQYSCRSWLAPERPDDPDAGAACSESSLLSLVASLESGVGPSTRHDRRDSRCRSDVRFMPRVQGQLTPKLTAQAPPDHASSSITPTPARLQLSNASGRPSRRTAQADPATCNLLARLGHGQL